MTGRDIISYLKDLNVNPSNSAVCMSGDGNFLNKLDARVIGQGTFGVVYRGVIGKEKKDVVVKEAFISSRDLKLRAYGKHPKEYTLMLLVRDLLLTHQCPNFLYTYEMAVCRGCEIKSRNKLKRGTCYVTFMEPAHGDLSLFKDFIADTETQLSIILQLLCGLSILQKKYGMIHYDIKMENIMVELTPDYIGKYFEYVIDGVSYKIANHGFVVYIADFGVSYTTSPLVDMFNTYGTRNAEVIKNSDGTYIWKPITTNSGEEFYWADEKPSTKNEFTVDDDLTPDRPINLSDMERYPPFEFFGDTQDVLKIVLGGSSVNQEVRLNSFTHVNDVFRRWLKSFSYPSIQFSNPSIKNSVHYVLARVLLEKLYNNMSYEYKVGDSIIDTFYM